MSHRLHKYIIDVLIIMKTYLMLRVFSVLCLVLFSSWGYSNSNTTYYQVDMIIFFHADIDQAQLEFSPQKRKSYHLSAIPLKVREPGAGGLYQLMPTSTSSLKYAWGRLNQHSQYHPLFHYTWIQPSSSQRPVFLSSGSQGGWSIEGIVRVRQSNYYLLNTELQFSKANQTNPDFLFEQKQRLKPGNTYYLDHSKVGMLINVHRVSYRTRS